MNISTECYNYIESILGCKADLPLEDIISILSSIMESINSSSEKKKYDLLKKYIDDLKFLRGDNLEIYRQSREKSFYSNFKLDNKTRYYNTVSNDNLSPTMYAFYFCEKQRQILSDKESAALKAMSLDNNFEIIDEECNLRFKGGKEFDQISNNSNTNSNQLISSFKDPQNEKLDKPELSHSHLKKKRKYSAKSNGNSNRRYKKIARSSSRNVVFDDQDENTNRNYHNEDCNYREEDELCTKQCLFGRKYQKDQKEENDMIECDGCFNWYHIKCIGMTTEEFTFYINTKFEKWLCPSCKN